MTYAAVAVAPVPVALTKLTVGADVYPAPGLTRVTVRIAPVASTVPTTALAPVPPPPVSTTVVLATV
jgi:hypothetical protein